MKGFFLLCVSQLCFIFLFSQLSFRPFPQHCDYTKGTIKPNIPQLVMDSSVCSFYESWKSHYIKAAGNGQYCVFVKGRRFNKQSVSEGQGYGMVIVALMAGFDTSAQRLYNSLYYYYKSHPSKRSSYLMAWAQKSNFKDVDKSSASDGDMDIAFSLLLANTQWGNKGNIHYLEEAKQMIEAIGNQEVNLKTFSILKSNSVEYDSDDYFDMRPSDFMPDHFRAFQEVSKDSVWGQVINNNYNLFEHFQKKYSRETGLFSDFIVDIGKSVRPAPGKYEESTHDGDYDYNACRIPWRIAVDYLLHGDNRSKTIVEKINKWITTTTNSRPINISSGYTLNGKGYSKQEEERYFDAMGFMAPFAVSAMIDSKNQIWLNRLWNYIFHFDINHFDYYGNTIKMLDIIILSGNYWNSLDNCK